MKELTFYFDSDADKEYFQYLVSLGFNCLVGIQTNPVSRDKVIYYQKIFMEQINKDNMQEAEIVEGD